MVRKKVNKTSSADPRRNIVSVSVLLGHERIISLVARHSRPIVLAAIRSHLDTLRKEESKATAADIETTVDQVEKRLETSSQDRLRRVINATGILLHTGLGRAVLPKNAVATLAQLDHCCNLQIDMETGTRGKRDASCASLLCKLTGAEAAMVVNNNAAATFLVLAALAKDREVVISRGQLIEIGGSFRLPDCISQSGARMVEVGTTNKTHLRDYEQAITDKTAIILKVNPSNYRIVGFSKEIGTEELATLKKKHPVLVVDDLGCGALVNLEQYGLPKEPTVQDSIANGADIALFSGDKLIGGPQAGIIVGKKSIIDLLKKHPLSRMLRVCKLTGMVLEQTLRLFLNPDRLVQDNPTIRMLAIDEASLKQSATRIVEGVLKQKPKLGLRVVSTRNATGGGALPGIEIPGWAVALSSPEYSCDQVARILRQGELPIISHIYQDEVLLETRTLLDGDEESIIRILTELF